MRPLKLVFVDSKARYPYIKEDIADECQWFVDWQISKDEESCKSFHQYYYLFKSPQCEAQQAPVASRNNNVSFPWNFNDKAVLQHSTHIADPWNDTAGNQSPIIVRGLMFALVVSIGNSIQYVLGSHNNSPEKWHFVKHDWLSFKLFQRCCCCYARLLRMMM